jgi:hypothetical protein
MGDEQRPKEQVDLLMMLSVAPDTLQALVAGLGDDEARGVATGDEWPVSQIVAHMVDGERAWSARIRRMAREELPRMEPMPDADWARPPLSESLHEYRTLRETDFAFLEELPADAWSRPGVHTKWGPMDITWAARHLATHDAEHFAQIARALATRSPR